MPERRHSYKNVENPFLFEVAWEVAHKVGGIYTVLKTKAPVTCAEYGDRYHLIGPLHHQSAYMEVEKQTPANSQLRGAIKAMNDAGVRTLYGTWLIDGAPTVLLFDLESVRHRLNEWKADLWSNCGIPSPEHDTETNDAIIFGYLTAWFLGELCSRFKQAEINNAIITHVHEWLAGVVLPLINHRRIDVATCFTTHATLLGRYLCAGSVDFYNNLSHFDVDYEAGKRGIYHRYCIERAAAHSADVFTTVSHITAYESEHLLKRKPDGVTPNGLNVVKFSALHEFQNLHAQNKEKINNFVRGHFYGHYDFEMENTIYFFTAGRYEFRNKGVDMFIESLARLNHRLKHFNLPITVVAFIIMPAPTHNYTVDALKGQAVMKQLNDTVVEIQDHIGKRLFESAARGNLPNIDELMSDSDLVPLKRRIHSLKRNTLPPVVTHNMADDANDPILKQLRQCQLHNAREDRVKVVFHPEFLNANNPILGLDYEDFVRGCHLGVFPSYYEPWGYTPAECTVMGLPSISTNLSGFGCYMEEMIEDPATYGIYVVDRRMKSVEESLEQLVDQMWSFLQKSRRQRINQRNRTERLSDVLDWKRLGKEYVKARHLALRRKYGGSFDARSREGFSSEAKKVPRPLSAPSVDKVRVSPYDDDDMTLEVNELSSAMKTLAA